MRKLRLEDLLNRQPVQLDLEKIKAKLANNTLLVTGAGGSIGSDWCASWPVLARGS